MNVGESKSIGNIKELLQDNQVSRVNSKQLQPQSNIVTTIQTNSTYTSSIVSGGCIPNIPMFHDNDLNDAINIVDKLLFDNNIDKNQAINLTNDFHKIIGKMDMSELVNLVDSLANYVNKTDVNDSMLISLQKSVIDKIRDKNYLPVNSIEPPAPIPPLNDKNDVSDEELKWALELENKVKNGYTPNPKEIEKYQEIANKLLEKHKVQQPDPWINENNGSASQEEIQWALELENKVKNGYTPNPKEIEKYQEIAKKVNESNKPIDFDKAGVSDSELKWAVELMDKISNQGYKPTQKEIEAYTDVFNRYQKTQTNNNVSEAELKWADEFQKKVVQGYNPSQKEIEAYTEIFNRYQK